MDTIVFVPEKLEAAAAVGQAIPIFSGRKVSRQTYPGVASGRFSFFIHVLNAQALQFAVDVVRPGKIEATLVVFKASKGDRIALTGNKRRRISREDRAREEAEKNRHSNMTHARRLYHHCDILFFMNDASYITRK